MTPISVVVCDDVPELRRLDRIAEVALRLKASRYVRKGAPLEELRSAVLELAA